MSKFKLNLLPVVLFFMLFLTGSRRAVAQSTLVTVPSTDVVAEKHAYLEFDFISHYAKHEDGGFQSYVPRAVVGVGHNIEVGVNVVYTDGFGVNQPVELQPNVKWHFYHNEDKGVMGAAGVILYVPVTHRTGTNTFALFYAIMSKRVRGNYGPRLTGGGYVLVHRDDGTGAKSGAIAGYEQPLAPRVAFIMDWFSGHNRFGYVTPGFSFTTTRRSALYGGYSIGNQGRGNNALFIFYGVTF